MPKPRVLVLHSPGANCDAETIEAFRLAGAEADRVHINRVLESPSLLEEYQILCVQGGFSYGDDVAAGRVLGNQLRCHLADACRGFRDADKLILGVCNGFQVLMKTGLLDVDDEAGPLATLTWNDHGRYEARWVCLAVASESSVFLRGVERIDLPIAHAEGRVVFRDSETRERLAAEGRVAMRYASSDWSTGEDPLAFPANPNGAESNAAALADSTGRVLGMMPHPERFLFATQHPRWTRRDGGDAADHGEGLRVFRNAVAYFG